MIIRSEERYYDEASKTHFVSCVTIAASGVARNTTRTFSTSTTSIQRPRSLNFRFTT